LEANVKISRRFWREKWISPLFYFIVIFGVFSLKVHINRHIWRYMKITPVMPESIVLGELGERAQRHRVGLNLSQAELAKTSGVSQRTIERLEAGTSIQLDKILSILRALGLFDNLDQLFPDAAVRPMQMAGSKGRPRQRSSKRRDEAAAQGGWVWGDQK
jgi:transcriptional regulator with XRE-family HTH domain